MGPFVAATPATGFGAVFGREGGYAPSDRRGESFAGFLEGSPGSPTPSPWERVRFLPSEPSSLVLSELGLEDTGTDPHSPNGFVVFSEAQPIPRPFNLGSGGLDGSKSDSKTELSVSISLDSPLTSLSGESLSDVARSTFSASVPVTIPASTVQIPIGEAADANSISTLLRELRSPLPLSNLAGPERVARGEGQVFGPGAVGEQSPGLSTLASDTSSAPANGSNASVLRNEIPANGAAVGGDQPLAIRTILEIESPSRALSLADSGLRSDPGHAVPTTDSNLSTNSKVSVDGETSPRRPGPVTELAETKPGRPGTAPEATETVPRPLADPASRAKATVRTPAAAATTKDVYARTADSAVASESMETTSKDSLPTNPVPSVRSVSVRNPSATVRAPDVAANQPTAAVVFGEPSPVVAETVLAASDPGLGSTTTGLGTPDAVPFSLSGDPSTSDLVRAIGEARSDPARSWSGAALESFSSLETLSRDLTSTMRMTLQSNARTAVIRLNPRELGAVRIEIEVDGDLVRGVMQAERPAVRALLIQQLGELERSLERQGLIVDQLRVDDSGLDSESSGSSWNSSRENSAEERTLARRPTWSRPNGDSSLPGLGTASAGRTAQPSTGHVDRRV